MSQNLPFQNPQQAIIRLLKSQGCCGNGSSTNSHQHTMVQKQQLLQYKQQLQRKLQQERAKLNSIPCVITIAEQIQQLKDVITGLAKQNQDRLKSFEISCKQFTIRTSEMQQCEHEQFLQHQKLETQYNNLIKQLQLTNDTNQHLINKIAQSKINI